MFELFARKNKIQSKNSENIPSPEQLANSSSTGISVREETEEIPFDGFVEGRTASGIIDTLSDEDLQRVNKMLDWKCFTVDLKGRRFGNVAWKGKRNIPQSIPDPRIVKLDELLNLADKTVLEIGCFEGIHTIALCQRSKKVYAIDSRIENVVKTLVRCNLFGFEPNVSLCDVEQKNSLVKREKVDIIHHVGVLYHLQDPVNHILNLKALVKKGILLDTHYATEEMANDESTIDGKNYKHFVYKEKGRDEVFSGMYNHAKWLLLSDIQELLKEIGLSNIIIFNDELQRNGPRVTLLAYA